MLFSVNCGDSFLKKTPGLTGAPLSLPKHNHAIDKTPKMLDGFSKKAN
jgi:hypothetical protein